MPKLSIDGADIEVPDSVALHFSKTAERLAALEAQSKQAAEDAGRIKASADSAARAKEEALLRSEMENAAKKGELDKVIELSRAREQRFAENSLANALRSAAQSHPEVKRTGLTQAARDLMIGDLIKAIGDGMAFDIDSASVKDKTGLPVDVAAKISAAVGERSWMAEAKLPTGTGSTGTGATTNTGTGKTVSKDQYDTMTTKEKAAHFATGGAGPSL